MSEAVYIPEPEDLSKYKVIGWYGEMGENYNGDWGKCPDCGKACLYIDGKPTVIHKGKVK